MNGVPGTSRFGALRNVGVRACLASALLFGAGAPAAKLLLGTTSPWLLAGLLYAGSGAGLGLFRLARRAPKVRPARADLAPLGGAILAGGIAGPVLLLLGLSHLPASGASLLLNAEGVFTAALAWFVFKENFDRRVAVGMLAIIAGAVVVSVPAGLQFGSIWPSLAILGACLAWGIDNNLTRKIALTDATWLAAVKGLVAGPVNLALAFLVGAALPAVGNIAAALLVGFFGYGVSLVLFIIGLRHVGTARAGAYYSIAPFFGALLAVLLGDHLTWPLIVAGILMAVGIWLHLTEQHQHRHQHTEVTHDHWHTHNDGHHLHPHLVGAGAPAGGHKHPHAHQRVTHGHEHFPDSHHRHEH
jgi:drug/metabolite transporter (DMT)-like permease